MVGSAVVVATAVRQRYDKDTIVRDMKAEFMNVDAPEADYTRTAVATQTPVEEAELAQANAALQAESAERKQAEEALRESEERFRQLAENASDLVYRVRILPDYRLEYVSPSVARILGYMPEEFRDDPDLPSRIVHPDDRGLRDLAIRQLYGAKVSQSMATVRYIRKDGQVIWTEHRIAPIYDTSGRLVAIEGIGRDVTERVQAQQLLEQRVEERTQEIQRRRQAAEVLREILTALNSNRPLLEVLDFIVGLAVAFADQVALALETARLRVEPEAVELQIDDNGRGFDPAGVAPTHFGLGIMRERVAGVGGE